MRASQLLDADPAAAAREARAILAAWPECAEAELLLAAAHRRLGDAEAALRVLEPLVGADLGSALMQLELGRAHAAAGRHDAALAAFKRSVDIDPRLADGWRELAAQSFRAGDSWAGDAAYLRYCRLTPDPPELMDALVALSAGRLEAAQSIIRKRLSVDPCDVAALRLLGDVAAKRGDPLEARMRLMECLALAPGYAAARYDLARSLYALQRLDELLPELERLLAVDPQNGAYLSLKAQALRLIGRNDEAIDLVADVVARHPADPDAWVLLGNLHRDIGDQSRAVEAYRRAFTLPPGDGQAYWALANLKTVRFTAEDLGSLQQAVSQSPQIGPRRVHLEFALGKALEDEGRFAESFEHYAFGNAVHRGTLDYDADATTAFVERSKAVYSTRFFAGRAGWGSHAADPIFIIGLPRSGSTLVEQILASHSQVEGTRELPEMPAIATDLAARLAAADASEYPAGVATLTAADAKALANRYLERTSSSRPQGSPRFVDKMLGNFSHVGLIHLLFPRATLIDVRRHPMACGFACFKQLFPQGMKFSYDLGELGRYYRDYSALMDQIDTVLPGRVYRLYYERLVDDPDGEIRRLLEHCGLAFEEQCLRFHDNRRVVQTVSSEQVRRPIYREAIDQWRHFEPWLNPLRAALGDSVSRHVAAPRSTNP